ncbi:uncharacterized protein [Diabrotica undecimpunctata]|uniref:uncharacterized protein isoform X5 n=1 Tax=Diabrotica undecimpunctata TaxID=50387 RepID=UPI003B63D0FA
MEINEESCKIEIENEVDHVFLDIFKTEFVKKSKLESKNDTYDCLEFTDNPVKTQIGQDDDKMQYKCDYIDQKMEVNEDSCKIEIENNEVGDVFLDIFKTEFVKEPAGEVKNDTYDCSEFTDRPAKPQIGQDEDTVMPFEEMQLNKKKHRLFKTTPSSLEAVMRTPFSKPYPTTTPAYHDMKRKEFVEDNNYFEDLDIYPNSSLVDADMDISDDKIRYNEEPINEIPYNGFFTYLQMTQKNLLKLTARESKMSVLKHLRNTLLSNLYYQITKLWKPQTDRQARGYKDDHEMEFPSNEGALMTISFLTFAVFLIKLVIKLVQALKTKYMMSTTTTTTAAPTLILLNRKKREESFNEEAARILTYIETFPNFN